MLIGNHVGFPTNGTNLCVAAIPVGQHGGRHRHGEEAIHVLRGTGFAVIAGRRYDVHAGTTVFIPYMDDHQLFNTGDIDLDYVSASTMDLDLYVKLGRLEQLEDKGPNPDGTESAYPAEEGQFDALGRRIALHIEDAPNEADRQRDAAAAGSRAGHGSHAHEDQSAVAGDPGRRLIKSVHPHRHGAIYNLMGGGESATELRNGFTAMTVAMTQIFEEVPHTSSHCHTHTEAILYVLEGVGLLGDRRRPIRLGGRRRRADPAEDDPPRAFQSRRTARPGPCGSSSGSATSTSDCGPATSRSSTARRRRPARSPGNPSSAAPLVRLPRSRPRRRRPDRPRCRHRLSWGHLASGARRAGSPSATWWSRSITAVPAPRPRRRIGTRPACSPPTP